MGGRSTLRPDPFTPGKGPVPVVLEAGWAQGRFGRVRKIEPTPKFDPRTVHPVASPGLLKLKQSQYWPRQGLRVPGGRGCQISGQEAYEGGKFRALSNARLCPQEIFLVLISVSIVLPIGRSLDRAQLVSLEFFIYIKSFRSRCGPGVDSASNRNEYQDYFLVVKAAGA